MQEDAQQPSTSQQVTPSHQASFRWLGPFLKLGRGSPASPPEADSQPSATPDLATCSFSFSGPPTLSRRSKSMELPAGRSFFDQRSSDSPRAMDSVSQPLTDSSHPQHSSTSLAGAQPGSSPPATPAVPIPRVFMDDNPFPRLPSLRDWAFSAASSSSGGSRFVQRQPSLHDWIPSPSLDSQQSNGNTTASSGPPLLTRSSSSAGSAPRLLRLDTPPASVGFQRISIASIPEGDHEDAAPPPPLAAAAAGLPGGDASASQRLPPKPRSTSTSPTRRRRAGASPEAPARPADKLGSMAVRARSPVGGDAAGSPGPVRPRSPATKRSHSPGRPRPGSSADATAQPKSPRLVYHSPYSMEPPVSSFAARSDSSDDIAAGFADFRSVMDSIWGRPGSAPPSPGTEAGVAE